MSDALALRDIHLPPDISWWPPAPGWWGLLLLSLCLLGWLLWRWLSRRALPPRALSVSVSALQELERIERSYQHDPQALVRELSVLLRRIAISLYGRHKVAGLTGSAWLRFLDQQSHRPIFSQQFQQALTEWPYRPQGAGEVAALVQEVRQWLEQQGSARHV